MPRGKTNARQPEHRNFSRPVSEATLRSVLVAIIQETMPNLPSLREKEWAMREIERFKTDKLEGQQRMIKNTGIVRNSDDLGRVVIPMELRRTMNISPQDDISISLDDANGWIVLELQKRACHFCGSTVDVNDFKSKLICENCVGTLFESV